MFNKFFSLEGNSVMKKIAVVAVLGSTLSLAGCSTTGPGQTIGTGVGAVGGYGVARALGAGSGGAAAGAVVGALIGNSVGAGMDQQNAVPRRRVIVEERYIPMPPRRPYCTYDRVYDPYYGVYRERRICR